MANINGITDFKVDSLSKEKFETENLDEVKESAAAYSSDKSEIET